jgi:hypothetical protein
MAQASSKRQSRCAARRKWAESNSARHGAAQASGGQPARCTAWHRPAANGGRAARHGAGDQRTATALHGMAKASCEMRSRCAARRKHAESGSARHGTAWASREQQARCAARHRPARRSGPRACGSAAERPDNSLQVASRPTMPPLARLGALGPPKALLTELRTARAAGERLPGGPLPTPSITAITQGHCSKTAAPPPNSAPAAET